MLSSGGKKEIMGCKEQGWANKPANHATTSKLLIASKETRTKILENNNKGAEGLMVGHERDQKYVPKCTAVLIFHGGH